MRPSVVDIQADTPPIYKKPTDPAVSKGTDVRPGLGGTGIKRNADILQLDASRFDFRIAVCNGACEFIKERWLNADILRLCGVKLKSTIPFAYPLLHLPNGLFVPVFALLVLLHVARFDTSGYLGLL